MAYPMQVQGLDASGNEVPLKMTSEGQAAVSSTPAVFEPETGVITANGQAAFFYVDDRSRINISMVAASLNGHNATFEYSNNSTTGADGNWFGVQVARTNSNTIEPTSGVLASTPGYGWNVSVQGYRWFRIRATAHTTGTATYTIGSSAAASDPVQSGPVTGPQPVTIGTLPVIVGQGAEDAAIAGNAVRTSGRARTTAPTTFVNGDTIDQTMALTGAAIVKPYSVPEIQWNSSNALTTATAVAIQAAAGASLKRHPTAIQAINTGASTVDLIILDGVTERWRLPLPVNIPVQFEFASHLIVTANTALNANLSAVGTVRLNAQGYTAM